MGGSNSLAPSSYGYAVGGMFVFNLIVGIGALAMPYGFQSAGLISGVGMLALIGLLAFICVTYVIEILSHANAVNRLEEKTIDSYSINDDDEKMTLVTNTDDIDGEYEGFDTFEEEKSIFEITEKVEMGTMSEVFMGQIGQKIFYGILIIYLYGDLAIYAASVPDSLAETLNGGCGFTIGSLVLDQDVMYYIWLVVFTIFVTPFCYFEFQNTKYLQMVTIVCRYVAFALMIVIAFIYIFKGEGRAFKDTPWFNYKGIPVLFGTTIYSFMCHHSIPGMITPIKSKRKLTLLMGAVYVVIFVFYVGLCVSALFAFQELDSLYTLNFVGYKINLIGLYLGLFPVFTLTTNYPLICITLRNNLMHLITYGDESKYAKYRKIIFSTAAAFPGILIAFITKDVNLLVSYTGSYAGLGIMLLIPPILVYFSRKRISQVLPNTKNPYKSPFQHVAYIYVIIIAACISLILTTLNNGVSIACFFDDEQWSFCTPSNSTNLLDCSDSSSHS
eukprot:TRINITY_DN601_c0_g1_i1.p1 TRINITY_DN601_c0_g1~~TRINITY_DN601_c0_g1_i1.p1  ORF type:complete len:501 (+),score=129.76 TRINITY_DN601_c0_g1_i1:43-1545(+)